MGGFEVHWFGIDLASPAPMLPIGRPLMNSPTRRFWISLRAGPPVWLGRFSAATISSAVNCRIDHAVGAWPAVFPWQR
jgi:hypothetical protein